MNDSETISKLKKAALELADVIDAALPYLNVMLMNERPRRSRLKDKNGQ